MISKIKKYLSFPIKDKLKIILYHSKVVIRKFGFIIIRVLNKPLNSTKKGRQFYFDSVGENELLCTKTLEGIYYIVNSSDKIIGKSIYVNKKSFDAQHLIAALNLISRKNTLLLDVGANLGTIGILGVFKGYFEKCIAFEPDPNNFKLLSSNVYLNGLGGNFELRNEALSNIKKGTLNFELSETNHGDHRVKFQNVAGKYNEDNRKVITVKVNTLDSVLQNHELDNCVLFMDTQGHEGHILDGAKVLIQRSVPIVTEFWPYGLNRSNGLNLFYESIENSNYTTIWNLKNPNKKINFSIDQLKKIASNLGFEGSFTDLVITNDDKN